jgi:hypothetical protein
MAITLTLAVVLALGPPRVIGLVEIPSVLSEPQAAARRAVTLRTEPSDAAPVACVVRAAEDVDTREHGYEELSAVVYETRTGWYGLRCHGSGDRLAWLPAKDTGPFRPLEELVQHGLAYLTTQWDRSLYEKPRRSAASHRLRLASREPDITVADSTVVDGELWLLVIVFGEGRCRAEEPGPVVDAGWIPAHAANGESAAWFYSRGC